MKKSFLLILTVTMLVPALLKSERSMPESLKAAGLTDKTSNVTTKTKASKIRRAGRMGAEEVSQKGITFDKWAEQGLVPAHKEVLKEPMQELQKKILKIPLDDYNYCVLNGYSIYSGSYDLTKFYDEQKNEIKFNCKIEGGTIPANIKWHPEYYNTQNENFTHKLFYCPATKQLFWTPEKYFAEAMPLISDIPNDVIPAGNYKESCKFINFDPKTQILTASCNEKENSIRWIPGYQVIDCSGELVLMPLEEKITPKE